jgi:hypothetical protein
MSIRIGINGFGRIGRQVYRAIRERCDKEIDVVAVNDIGRINIMAHLLKYDSTYGRFPGDVVALAGLPPGPRAPRTSIRSTQRVFAMRLIFMRS